FDRYLVDLAWELERQLVGMVSRPDAANQPSRTPTANTAAAARVVRVRMGSFSDHAVVTGGPGILFPATKPLRQSGECLFTPRGGTMPRPSTASPGPLPRGWWAQDRSRLS